MAEETKSMTYEYTDAETGKDYIFFSTDGEPKGLKQFEGAAVHFEQPGSLRFTTPPGFTALEKGSFKQQARSTFQGAVDFLYKASDKMTLPRIEPSTVDKLLGTNIAGTVKSLDPEAQRMAEITARNASSGTAKSIISTVDTPEEAAVTAAMAGLGPVKALSQTSGYLPTAVRALTAAGASAGMSKAMGTFEGENMNTPLMHRATSQALLTGAAVVVTDGVVGIFSKVLGPSLPQKAVKQVEDDVRDAIAKYYPQVKYQGNDAINKIAMSSHKDMQRITELGMKAVRNSADESVSLFIDDIDKAMPKGLSKGIKEGLSSSIEQYRIATDTLFDNIDNPSLVMKMMRKRQEMTTNITKVIVDDMKDQHAAAKKLYNAIGQKIDEPSFEGAAVRLQAIMDQYKQADLQYLSAAKVMSILKKHNPDGGFDVTKFQEAVKNSFYTSDPMLKEVIMAATRGTPNAPNVGGVDKQHGIPINAVAKWILDKSGLKMPPMVPVGAGTTYTGTVRGKIPFGTINVMTNDAVKDFLRRMEPSEHQ